MMMKRGNIIEADKISFIRGNESIIEDFSFNVRCGDFVAVIGPNGAGKSTLIHMILGLLPIQTGSLRVFGLAPQDFSARHRIGYVPQRGGAIEAFFPATADEVVYSGLTRRWRMRLSRRAQQMAVKKAFASLGIEDLRPRMIGALSGGERQRVLLARALVINPDLLILDEPFDGLDPDSREEFHDLLRVLKKKGKTILVVTHDVHRISQEADAAICLRHALVCHGDHTCLIRGKDLHNLFHADREELIQHHGN